MDTQKKTPIWHITNIRDDTILELHGAIKAKRVSIAIAGGVSTDILIPDTEFNPDRVNDMAHKMAMDIINSMGLEGPDMQDYINQTQYGIAPVQ